VAAVRSAVRTTDARLPVTEIKTVENLMDDNVSYRKFVVGLFAGLAILALLLATLHRAMKIDPIVALREE
jgi:hypothetical protein